MEKSNFRLLCDNIISEQKIVDFEEKQNEVIFKNKEFMFKIKNDLSKKLISLYSCKDLDDISKNSWIMHSTWHFDEQSASQEKIKLICADFNDVLNKNNKNIVVKQKIHSEHNDGLFFANRFMNIFPELRGEIQDEKEKSSKFRTLFFTNEKILPKIIVLLKKNIEKKKIEKLFNLLSEQYSHGNIEVRSVITMVILSRINKEIKIELVENYISDEFRKVWSASIKYKNATKNSQFFSFFNFFKKNT